MPSKTKKSAAEQGRRLRLWIFLAGAFLGLVLAQLAGTLLDGELQTLQRLFIPLSALAGGLAALGASTHFASLADTARDIVRRRRLRAVLTVLGAGTVLLLGLYLAFAKRVSYRTGDGARTRSVAYLVGWSRSERCDCSVDDVTCIKEMMGDPDADFHTCWNGVWAVELGLALSYLLTLGSAGIVIGVLMIPAKSQAPGAPQPPPGYLDFDLWIDQRSEGLYRAKAWSGAGFEATGTFSLPPSLAGGELRPAGAGSLRGGSAIGGADAGTLEHVGDELFRTVFQGELLKAFQGCLAKARSGPGLRIRLRLNDVPQLADLPWEYLHVEGQGFLALSARTPVVRYLELSEGLSTLLVEPPLRVLAVISTPLGYRELAEADEEWRRLGAALEPLLRGGLIEVERLERPTFEALEARLRGGPPVHVLHFVGHGGFSEIRAEGVLVFEDENGKGVPVGGPSLAYLLQDHPSLRLAVLNACNGARASREDTFAGTAQALVQHGVPAVIAMQSEVMDETACGFAEKFYRALASGLPVDACVGEVRRALAAERNPEWGTPALYLRATDGRLFAVESGGNSN
ncbi:MAG TPA: CHAT domain-containing protein [Thermoanaerobaculia bacterium]|nr:CHAT domain-containing protein [Thermoanaerobaculia bacterium]